MLAGSLGACDELDEVVESANSPSTSQEVEESAAAAEPTEEATEEPAEDPTEDPAAEQSAGTGPDDGHGPDDGQQSHATLPGDCPNDIPLPEVKHGVLSTESEMVDDFRECHIVVSSRGDSLGMILEIAEQLKDIGYTEMTAPSDDSSEDALNTMSYLGPDYEVVVTTQQDGVSGIMLHYVLINPERGNG